ncbi:Exodeoxyribonuclease V alpha chain [Acholeplasma oculi]|uniref:ATP-dependent DNA helicase n=1 Tax=Acholeplasma oculi TaxID=35623 RepID=UPI000695E24C|nr:ATP-dependent RecD-like DNA helicase [Acholeplasma oculi]SKC43370.1 UvrD-like helicase C-terminal domain-containing protein [Acholeplasma oculi]SUT88712.1 Exodeoxyribonuclease V alpha chain [Acholeplasma oculi]
MKSYQALINVSNAIDENLSSGLERDKLSTNILAQLRNLIDALFFMLYEKEQNVSLEYNWSNIPKTRDYCYSKSKYKLLYKFYDMLQVSTSHYTLDNNNSERVMLKYFEYLVEIKNFTNTNLNVEILKNIQLFPINQDKTFDEYYLNISSKILSLTKSNYFTDFKDRFYVEKIKPFYVDGKIFYEITLSPCNDKRSKFDRMIVFSKFKIVDNYAVKIGLIDTDVSILGLNIPIKIISNWMISIRPCEVNNLAKIFKMDTAFKSETKEFYETMKYLTMNNLNLFDIVTFSDIEYKRIFDELHENKRVSETFFSLLNECRKIVKKNKPGSNIIRYFLYSLKNKVIKTQYQRNDNTYLSNLKLEYGCIPFDKMPYCTSLINHNPRLFDLFECIPIQGREHELMARKIKNNTEHDAMLYTPIADLVDFEDLNTLIDKYNKSLYYKHLGRRLEIDKKQIYISEYEKNTMIILDLIFNLTKKGIDQYKNTVDFWLNEYNEIDDKNKIDIIRKMFSTSEVAAIYGSAGTGKTTLLNHVANFFKDNKKLFLANTNTAVDNLRKKVNALNCSFSTIAKHIYKPLNTDILIIDESSTVSNSDMVNILKNTKYKLLIVVGDVYQIESISFGNWFGLLRKFIKNSSYELNHPYRTEDKNLRILWDLVRKNEYNIVEHLSKNQYCKDLDTSIFDYDSNDEIILCLNYDGLYGVNNINRLLQLKNPNSAYQWGIWTYKVNDPVIFNESERFPNVIYNNLKGIIRKIILNKDNIDFEVEIDRPLNSFNLDEGLELISSKDGKSVIKFNVTKDTDSDNDDSLLESIIPFQISYAVSIHKAQGLDYDSVKLIITSEIEENITHNIFYTAITRARKKLTIYWSPETQNNIINSFKLKNIDKEYGIISEKMNLKDGII